MADPILHLDRHTPAPSAWQSADRLNIVLHARRHIKIVARRSGVLAGFAVAGLLMGVFRAVITPDVYRCWSVLRIAPRVQTGFTSQAQYQEVLDKYYENQLYDMQSAAVLDRVARRVRDSYKPRATAEVPPPRFRAIRGQGSFFQIIVDHGDYDYAKLFAEIWAQEFVEFKSRLKSDAFDKTARATREEVLRYEEKLARIRADILEFKKRHDVANTRETLNAAQELLNQLVAEQSKYSTLRQLLENTTKEAIANGAPVEKPAAAPATKSTDRGDNRAEVSDPLAKFTTAGSRYRELMQMMRAREFDRDRWSKALRPKHDLMVTLEQEIVRIRRDIDIELGLIEENRLALLESYRQNERSYEPLIRKQNEIVLNSSGIQHEFNKLTEEEALLAKQLADLRRSLAELDLTLNNTEDDLTISEQGSGLRSPVAPNRPRLVFLGLLAGLAAGVGMVWLLHRLDDRLEIAEDIESELDAPVLGQVPLVERKAGAAARLLAADMPQHDVFCESIRGVRSSLLLNLPSRPCHVIVVTSAVPGDGKTTFTGNLAASLALLKHRVLLVDVDLRRGAAHEMFRCQRGPGLSEVLEGQSPWKDVVRTTEVNGLSLIPTGPLPENPGELLLGPAFAKFLEDSRKDYQFIILDTPPLVSINDTFALLPSCDGVLFVVRAGQTSMRFARSTLAAIRQRQSKLLGLILNGITADNPYYYYQQYYHAYYRRAEAGESSARRPSSSGAS